MRELYAGACILYVYSSLHSYHNQRLKMGGEVAGFSWCQCLVWQHRGMDSESFYLGTMRQNKLLRGLRFSFHREI